MRRWVWCVMVCAMVWVGSGSAWADAEKAAADDEPVEAREVVVSATKTPLPISQVTSAIQVIRGEELEEKKIKTVIDALRLAQGLTVFSNGGPGTNATARIRGANAAHTLVLIDGAIVNSPTSGDFNFANLTAENIEQIEILRGAQSMLYGSDAMGGVINIITKKGKGPLTGSAFLEYGSFATLREGGQVSGTKGPVDYAVSLSRWDTSSFSVANYRRGATERDGFHNWQGSGRLGMALPKDGRLDFTARWWNSDVALDNVTTTAKFDVLGSKSTTQALILSASYDQPLTSWWSQKLTVGQNNERLQFDPGTVRRNLETGVVSTVSPRTLADIEVLNRRVEWQHNFQVGKPLLLSAGYQGARLRHVFLQPLRQSDPERGVRSIPAAGKRGRGQDPRLGSRFPRGGAAEFKPPRPVHLYLESGSEQRAPPGPDPDRPGKSGVELSTDSEAATARGLSIRGGAE